MTHICVSKLTIIGSDYGLSPGLRQAIIRNNAGLLLIETLGTNLSEISIANETFPFKKMHLKISSAKWRPFCLGFNVLKWAIGEWEWGQWHRLAELWDLARGPRPLPTIHDTSNIYRKHIIVFTKLLISNSPAFTNFDKYNFSYNHEQWSNRCAHSELDKLLLIVECIRVSSLW